MLYFRACPRCHTGTVEFSSDSHGPYLACLNCGFHVSGNAYRNFNTGHGQMVTGTARVAPEMRTTAPRPAAGLAAHAPIAVSA